MPAVLLILTTLLAQAPGNAAAAQAEREKKFAALLTGAELQGAWRMKEGEAPDFRLGEARPEKYAIDTAVKASKDLWIITARIQYAGKDATIPVPVRVVWAEDTPMITVTSVRLPVFGTYSARVIFHEGFYSGIWYGGGHAGVMSGEIRQVVPATSDRPAKSPS